MHIRIEVNQYTKDNIQTLGVTVEIYGKKGSEAKELAKKIIDTVPEKEESD